ncbi:competence protein ComK [Alkalihalobacillus sp. MEB130]|uniref:competence protein ComK n=1 Tax=Alkalihalobacillus sp. MEB130 TaxID=2976704 RepID=UPI0028DE11A9|nr:competence protein ComK [Alkalihalobacillus sp. MEB130]MDT8863060.1 competence protein ComK [Alkalihalobacillus sp. MEB130]
MPKTILPHYEINRDTTAIFPANHTDYYSIVWERNRIYYIKKTPIQLIRAGCLEGGADFDGRKAAVIHKTGIQSKIPMPIDPNEHIYAFPTHSPKLHECCWIFYHHIRSIKHHPKSHSKSIITFQHHKQLELDISYHTLEKQLQRTSYCIVRFSHYKIRSSQFE